MTPPYAEGERDPQADVRLVVLAGPDEGSVYEFQGYNAFVVGRAAAGSGALQVPQDPYFSRYHMLFELGPGGCFVTDLGSRNGVFVNGTRVHEAELKTEDEIEAGRTRLRVEILKTLPAGGDAVEGPPRSVLPRAGDRLGVYELEERIGSGAFGAVFSAKRVPGGGTAAVKVLLPEHAMNELTVRYFRREVELTSQLHHPNVVEVYDAGRSRGVLWLALELCEGPTLEERVEMGGPLEPTEAHAIGAQILRGLACAHERGVVHRDVKPGNVLFVRDDDSLDVKIGDFGIALPCAELGLSRLTESGEPRGTPRFMAPEQLVDAKRCGPQSDVYGVGATLYWCLTDTWHYDGIREGSGVWEAILRAQAVPLRERRPEIPVALAEVVDRALERAPEDRFASAAPMLEALTAAAS